MEEALYDTYYSRQLAELSLERIPGAPTILNFRPLVEIHGLAACILGALNGYMEIATCRCA